MGIVVGIDIGGSTTKIAGFQGKDMLIPVQISANNAIASLFGAFGKFLYDNKLALEDIQQVNLTGVGCSAVDQAIYGLPTYRVDEFTANGVGGGYFAQGKKEFMVVSMGTGTSFVGVKDGIPTHLGGIGIGGGTIIGLSKLMLNTSDIDKIQELALGGQVGHIDLRVGDILHMVIESICQTAALISQGTNMKDFILIGALTNFPECEAVCGMIKTLFPDLNFYVPKDGEYGTAIGTALAEKCCLKHIAG